MASQPVTGATVTFTAVHNGRFLFVQRTADDPILGGYWGFPGGKIEIGETIAGAIERECLEETGLSLTGRAFFVDSYLLGKRIGLHFAVEVTAEQVKLDELQDHAWVSSVAELATFTPRIPGIDTHLHYVISQLGHLHDLIAAHPALRSALEPLVWDPLTQFDLVEHRFLNR